MLEVIVIGSSTAQLFPRHGSHTLLSQCLWPKVILNGCLNQFEFCTLSNVRLDRCQIFNWIDVKVYLGKCNKVGYPIVKHTMLYRSKYATRVIMRRLFEVRKASMMSLFHKLIHYQTVFEMTSLTPTLQNQHRQSATSFSTPQGLV